MACLLLSCLSVAVLRTVIGTLGAIACLGCRPNKEPPPAVGPEASVGRSRREEFATGYFSAAAEVVRLHHGNGHVVKGVVFANGSDWGPQPMTMYAFDLTSNTGSRFEPRWVSEDSGYHTGMCVGDLNGDGKNTEDLVVTTLQDVYLDELEGGLKIYYGKDSDEYIDAFDPAVTIAKGFPASGCAVGDLDGDQVPEILVGDLGAHGVGRVYQRDAAGSEYRRVASFGAAGGSPCDSKNLAPSAVAIDDVNGDEVPDLVLAGKHLAIYYGVTSGSLAERYPVKASWCSHEEFGYSPSLHIQGFDESHRTAITVSQSRRDKLDGELPTSWLIYEPAVSTDAIVSRIAPKGAVAGPAFLTNLALDTGDRSLDLITSIHFDTNKPEVYGGALTVFRGTESAPLEPAEKPEEWHPVYRPVVSMLKAVNLRDKECDDLLVVSSHPAIPSALFVDAGTCPSLQ